MNTNKAATVVILHNAKTRASEAFIVERLRMAGYSGYKAKDGYHLIYYKSDYIGRDKVDGYL